MKAFPIPHLENNAFLYADLPPSFQLTKAEAPKKEDTLKEERKQDDKAKEVPISKVMIEDRTATTDTQATTTRSSSQCAEEPKPVPHPPYERNLLAECKKLIANVNAMKQKQVLADSKAHSSSPIPPPSRPISALKSPQNVMSRLSLDEDSKSSKRAYSRRRRSDEQGTGADVSASFVVPSMGFYKGNKENSDAKKPVRRSLSREKGACGGLKSNMGYLKDVYTVIEQHAKHCQDLKKDLKRLKSDFQENLSRMK